jgi:hypothetical protein
VRVVMDGDVVNVLNVVNIVDVVDVVNVMDVMDDAGMDFGRHGVDLRL